MGFFFALLLAFVVNTILVRIFSPRIHGPSPDTNIQVPTAEERPIPVLLGTRLIKGVNTLWWGDVRNEAIKKSGGLFAAKQTIGYKYYVGMELGIVNGPVELLEVRFDDRPVPNGTISIISSDQVIRFGDGLGSYTATIPTGQYSSFSALGKAAADAMILAFGGGGWKVVCGYEIQPGYNNELIYAVKVTGGSSTNYSVLLPAGAGLTGLHFASVVETALNAKEATVPGGARVHFTVTYDTVTQKFTVSAASLIGGLDGWYLRGIVTYAQSALPTIGMQMGADRYQAGFPSSTTSDYTTGEKRFTFAYSGLGGKLLLSDLAFTALLPFGLIHGSDVTIGGYMAPVDRTISGQTIYDLGDYYQVVVNQPGLFGGDEREGGIVGTMDVYKGTLTQLPNDYLEAKIGRSLSAHRGRSYAVLRQMYLGTTPYLKAISFVMRSTPNTLGIAGGKHVIQGDANPACGIYEWLVNAIWSNPIAAAKIDSTAFLAAADTLYTEDFGVSLLQDSYSTGAEVIGNILRHVDGLLFIDPDLGKLSIGLARNDYDPATLSIFNNNNAEEIKVSRPSWQATRDSVRVKFLDRDSNYQERTAMDQNLASIQARSGAEVLEEFEFLGISRSSVAQRVASRVLNTVDYAFAVATFKVNREAWKLHPAGVFKLVDPEAGTLVMRVLRIREGTIEDARLTVECAEDIFSIDWVGFGASDPTEWKDPFGGTRALLEERLEEAPYAIVAGTSRKIITMGARDLTTPIDGYKVWSDPAGGSAFTETQDVTALTPLGSLTVPIGPTETTLIVDGLVDIDAVSSTDAAGFAAGLRLALLEDEWIAFQTIVANADGTYSLTPVARGVMDTVPKAHGAGSLIFFFSEGSGFTQSAAYGGLISVAAKLLPYNGIDTLALGSALRHDVPILQRTERPYPPTAFTINGVAYPEHVFGELAIAWSHRNRLGTWDYDDSGATGARETSTHYRIKIYGDGGTLKHTETPVTGTTWTYLEAIERAENGGNLNTALRIVIESVQDGGSLLVSRQAIDWSCVRGGGTGWGSNYGGNWS